MILSLLTPIGRVPCTLLVHVGVGVGVGVGVVDVVGFVAQLTSGGDHVHALPKRRARPCLHGLSDGREDARTGETQART